MQTGNLNFPGITRLNRNRLYIVLELLVLLILCYFPLCYRMDSLVIRQWDEARNAVHTVEMLQNHNYIVRYFEGVPELWEPKPPLLVWLQVLSAKAFGLNEISIRMPVMLATFLTVLLLVLYFYRYFNNRYVGYIAALVLVTSQGYIDRHIARTGDHDALLILFLTAIILHFYHYLIETKPRPGILIGIALLFALGVYTKSVAALFIIPGLIISVFIFRSGRKLFADKWFYVAIACFILITGSYYLIREHMQPGYLNAVWHWELFPRYANTENKFDSGTFLFYAQNFYKTRFTYWIWILVPAIITLPLLLKGAIRRFYVYILLNTMTLFTILSIGSKGLWYDGPLYPFFAIIIGLFLYKLFTLIREKIPVRKSMVNMAGIVALMAIFLYPYVTILKKVSRTTEYPWDLEYYSMGYVLRNQQILDQLPDPLKVVFEGYNAHLLFYVKAENYVNNNDRLYLGNFSIVKPGDAIMLSQSQVLDSIERKLTYEIIYSKEPVKVIRIIDLDDAF